MDRAEHNREIYQLTRHYIEVEMLEGKLDITPYLQPNFPLRYFDTLNDIYNHLLNHARNRGSGSGGTGKIFGSHYGRNTIGNPSERYRIVRELLCDFDPHEITANWDIYKLFAALKDEPFKLNRPTIPVFGFCSTIITGANYLCKFKTADEFYNYFENVSKQPGDQAERMAQKELSGSITGFGPALSLDFLKELGFANYVKPDVHTMEICYGLGLTKGNKDDRGTVRVMKAIATDAEQTPYSLDRMFWLIGSGSFGDHDELPVEHTTWARGKFNNKWQAPKRREKFIEYMKEEIPSLA